MLFLDISDLFLFFGRLHPLVVHFPIGFLVIAFLMEIVARQQRNTGLSQAINFVLFWGFISAVLACIFGWLLSQNGDYDENALDFHKWTGIVTAIASGIVYYLKTQKDNSLAIRWYFPSFIVAMLLLTVAGHLGGDLTHGSDYLTQPLASLFGGKSAENSSSNLKQAQPVNPETAIFYQHLIVPIFEQKCYSCHNKNKQKGGLRMDTPDFLTKGGKHGVVIVSGKSAESELIKRVLLPESDEDRMPPKGKTPPTEEDFLLLKWWIDAGCSFDKKVTELDLPAEVKKIIESRLGNATDSPKKESAVLSLQVPPADTKVIEELRKKGVLITPVANGSNLLEVSFVNATRQTDANLEKLSSLSEQIIWLKLGSTDISDKGMVSITKLKNLQKLSLENTKITDNGLQNLKTLSYLEYLNLYGTQVTDKGIQWLYPLKNLQNLYIWQTKITPQGVTDLKKNLPSTQVTAGLEIAN
jgi:uncharacterized membrane protein